MAKQLSISARVDQLLTEAEQLADDGEHAKSLKLFQAAWDLLPEPKEDCEPAFRLLGAIGDAHFFLGDWDACHSSFQRIVQTWGEALANPFVRLRLGQSLFELGNMKEAANWMAPAFLSEGMRLFEDDDPKYLNFIRSQLKPPPGGWAQGW